MSDYTLGLVGLGVMGQNLALNVADKGFSLAGFDRDAAQVTAAREAFAGQVPEDSGERALKAFEDFDAFVASLEKPRKVLLLVPAGEAVDAVIDALKHRLETGDLIVDGGNSHFPDTVRRFEALKAEGFRFVGTGISGGEEGARLGPSIMPGGDPEAWPLIRPVFEAIAARTDDGVPCCAWVGSGGAGHFVKMVHNGIEYGDMQLICEAYLLMDRLLGMAPPAMGPVFAAWNAGELKSYLIEITAAILGKVDEETGKPMVDVILDRAGQKGTGKWTSQAALDLGVPAQTIAEAVFARGLSALKDERVKATEILPGPDPSLGFGADTPEGRALIEKIRKALFASKICSYAQGFQLMAAADREFGWDLDLPGIALLWRAGCIIRAGFLGRIKEAYDRAPGLPNLLLDDYFRDRVAEGLSAWREVVALAVTRGVPVPAFASALAYYDGYRSARLPANLLQAQRDYFGAHTYERTDRPRGEFFHTQW